MNKSIRKEAELAAVAQRLQLDTLQRTLHTLGSRLDILESESARQSAELSCLDEEVKRLRNLAPVPPRGTSFRRY